MLLFTKHKIKILEKVRKLYPNKKATKQNNHNITLKIKVDSSNVNEESAWFCFVSSGASYHIHNSWRFLMKTIVKNPKITIEACGGNVLIVKTS
jgi:hypothetical protein